MNNENLKKNIHVVSLGCPKNLVDTEYLLAELIEKGYNIISAPDEASFIIINTCAFIEPAVNESIDIILEFAQLKEINPYLKIIVAGCLVSRYGKKLISELPEVDIFVTPSGLLNLSSNLNKIGKNYSQYSNSAPNCTRFRPRVLTNNNFSAYLKISDGCSNNCNYCTIPMIRGQLHSQPCEIILKEAAHLISSGVKELVIVAQDTTAYGRDLSGNEDIKDILKMLNQIEGISWIRLMYAYPSGINRKFLETMAELPKVVPYVDIPMQHVSKDVLKLMGRPGSYNIFKDKIELIRKILPDAAIRTSFIVGHPGEKEKNFKELIDFLQEAHIDWAGCFKYWPEEGTPSAALKDQISDTIKQERYDKLMSLQQKISKDKLSNMVNTIHDVLLEQEDEISGYKFKGRMKTQAPDVDGCVNITSGNGRVGEIVKVRITDSYDYDLDAKIL